MLLFHRVPKARFALMPPANGSGIPPSVDVVSTVGAGDFMVGGLIYGLLMRESSEHTLASGDCCCSPGGKVKAMWVLPIVRSWPQLWRASTYNLLI